MTREARRHSVQFRIWYARRHGQSDRVPALAEQLTEYLIGGILPDEPRNLVACCGTWWPLADLPVVLPCCGRRVGWEG